MVVVIAVSRISLRGSVKNSSSWFYPTSGLARIFPTLVVHSCYYSLVKLNTVIRTSYFNKIVCIINHSPSGLKVTRNF